MCSEWWQTEGTHGNLSYGKISICILTITHHGSIFKSLNLKTDLRFGRTGHCCSISTGMFNQYQWTLTYMVFLLSRKLTFDWLIFRSNWDVLKYAVVSSVSAKQCDKVCETQCHWQWSPRIIWSRLRSQGHHCWCSLKVPNPRNMHIKYELCTLHRSKVSDKSTHRQTGEEMNEQIDRLTDEQKNRPTTLCPKSFALGTLKKHSTVSDRILMWFHNASKLPNSFYSRHITNDLMILPTYRQNKSSLWQVISLFWFQLMKIYRQPF